MGISVDFLIKHVRPFGTDAYEALCTPGPGTLTAALLQAGVSQRDIDQAFTIWSEVASLPVAGRTLPILEAAGSLSSVARWTTLYPAANSTILFLTEPLIRELSYQSSRNAGRAFQFLPSELIPLAVTISNLGVATSTQNVSGAHVAADGSGNCIHLGGLIP
jgi:hypothetical protein